MYKRDYRLSVEEKNFAKTKIIQEFLFESRCAHSRKDGFTEATIFSSNNVYHWVSELVQAEHDRKYKTGYSYWLS